MILLWTALKGFSRIGYSMYLPSWDWINEHGDVDQPKLGGCSFQQQSVVDPQWLNIVTKVSRKSQISSVPYFIWQGHFWTKKSSISDVSLGRLASRPARCRPSASAASPIQGALHNSKASSPVGSSMWFTSSSSLAENSTKQLSFSWTKTNQKILFIIKFYKDSPKKCEESFGGKARGSEISLFIPFFCCGCNRCQQWGRVAARSIAKAAEEEQATDKLIHQMGTLLRVEQLRQLQFFDLLHPNRSDPSIAADHCRKQQQQCLLWHTLVDQLSPLRQFVRMLQRRERHFVFFMSRWQIVATGLFVWQKENNWISTKTLSNLGWFNVYFYWVNQHFWEDDLFRCLTQIIKCGMIKNGRWTTWKI